MQCLLLVLVPSLALSAETKPITLADLELACSKGDASACVDWGFNLEVKAPEQAVKIYRAACEKNTFPACSNLALMLKDARGGPKNLAEAARVAKKACDGGNAPGCFHLGLVQEAGQDSAGANAAYEKACTQRVFQGCTNFAVNLLNGVGGKADTDRAAAMLENACAQSVKKSTQYPSLRSCMILGQLQERKDPPNREAAKRLYRLACFGGMDDACERMGAGPKNVHEHEH